FQKYLPPLPKKSLLSDPPPYQPFESVSADLFEYGGQFFLVLCLLHLQHQGVTRTYNRAQDLFCWPSLKNGVVSLIEKC
ncbi:hypothetical protein TCAL_15648, partial [Tigriopus californicus]